MAEFSRSDSLKKHINQSRCKIHVVDAQPKPNYVVSSSVEESMESESLSCVHCLTIFKSLMLKSRHTCPFTPKESSVNHGIRILDDIELLNDLKLTTPAMTINICLKGNFGLKDIIPLFFPSIHHYPVLNMVGLTSLDSYRFLTNAAADREIHLPLSYDIELTNGTFITINPPFTVPTNSKLTKHLDINIYNNHMIIKTKVFGYGPRALGLKKNRMKNKSIVRSSNMNNSINHTCGVSSSDIMEVDRPFQGADSDVFFKVCGGGVSDDDGSLGNDVEDNSGDCSD